MSRIRYLDILVKVGRFLTAILCLVSWSNYFRKLFDYHSFKEGRQPRTKYSLMDFGIWLIFSREIGIQYPLVDSLTGVLMLSIRKNLTRQEHIAMNIYMKSLSFWFLLKRCHTNIKKWCTTANWKYIVMILNKCTKFFIIPMFLS